MASSKRSRKKSIAQHIVHLGTPGMPRVIKNLLGSRLGAPLFLGAIVAFAGSGVVSFSWHHGRPHIDFHQDRVTAIYNGVASFGSYLVPGSKSSTLPVSSQRAQTTPDQLVSQPGDTITIASFNIQVFGTSKAGKPSVMDILARIVRRFDVVAIQELRTTDPSVMSNFIRLINSTGRDYDFVIGPRLGRSDSKEQYVFVFDTQRIEVDKSTVQTIDDPKDLLHREPLVARFRTRVSPANDAFTFILANIHTDPDETKQELDALGDVFRLIQRNPWGEDDVILLGDLNVSYKKLGALGEVPNIAYTVHGEPTNTRGNKSYDNIVYSSVTTTEYTGHSGIINLQSEFGLTKEEALKVSDHFPIWAEFVAYESGSQTVIAKQKAAQAGAVSKATVPNANQPSTSVAQGTPAQPVAPSPTAATSPNVQPGYASPPAYPAGYVRTPASPNQPAGNPVRYAGQTPTNSGRPPGVNALPVTQPVQPSNGYGGAPAYGTNPYTPPTHTVPPSAASTNYGQPPRYPVQPSASPGNAANPAFNNGQGAPTATQATPPQPEIRNLRLLRYRRR